MQYLVISGSCVSTHRAVHLNGSEILYELAVSLKHCDVLVFSGCVFLLLMFQLDKF